MPATPFKMLLLSPTHTSPKFTLNQTQQVLTLCATISLLKPPQTPYCLHPALTPACTPFLSHSRSSSPSARQGFSCICPHPGTGPTPTPAVAPAPHSSHLPLTPATFTYIRNQPSATHHPSDIYLRSPQTYPCCP